jgi:hypothetical protein
VVEAIVYAIVAAASTAGISGAALTAVYYATTAAVYALTAIGASYAQQALAKSSAKTPDSPSGINAPEARGNVKQATPAQRLIVGPSRVGGAVFFYEVKPPYLYIGLLYSSSVVNRFKELYVNGDRKIAIPSIAENTITIPAGVEGQPNYPERLSFCVQHGTLDQGVNAIIAADFPELGSRFITPGIANAVFKCNYGDDYDEFVALWGNVSIPAFEWVIEGCPLPDPRVPGCDLDFDANDPEQLYAAMASWPYSENATLAQALWAALPCGLRATMQRINWSTVKPSADFDDEAVALKDGGFQRRHTVGGMISLSDKPNTVMESLMSANRGYPSQRAGLFEVHSSQPQEPVLTITDKMFLSGGFQFRRLRPKKDLANIARCTFIAPDRQYQDANGPVLRREDLIEADGEELEQSVRLSFTNTYQRAQRILKAMLAEARLDRYLTCKVPMVCYGLREGNIVRRFSETGRYARQNGLYSVEEWSLETDRSGVNLSLAEYDPSIARDWNPQTDELPFELEAAA